MGQVRDEDHDHLSVCHCGRRLVASRVFRPPANGAWVAMVCFDNAHCGGGSCAVYGQDEGERSMKHPAGAHHWTHRKPELIKRGTESHAAKLSAYDLEVLYRFADAGWQPSEIASHFGVT